MPRLVLPILASAALIALNGRAISAPAFQAPGPNLALGRPYTLNPEPNYGHCSRDPDRKLLTDGQTTRGFFWTQPTTVGWAEKSLVEIVVDLGRIEPITGASFSTAAGGGGVEWPWLILVLTSDDGRTYRMAGDLVTDSARWGQPKTGYATHRFQTDRIRTHGRYVKLVVSPRPTYLFCDEIEVHRGPESLLSLPGGEIVQDLKGTMRDLRLGACIKQRLHSDLAAVSPLVERAALTPAVKSAAQNELRAAPGTIDAFVPTAAADFRAVLPLRGLDQRLFALRGAALEADGWPRLVVWKQNRWDPLGPLDLPENRPAPPPALEIHTMLGEHRGDAFNLANASARPLSLTLRIEGLPGGPDPRFLRVHQVPLVDTAMTRAVADALPEAPRTDSGYGIELEAGMNGQVWLTSCAVDVAPGVHRGTVRLGGDDVSMSLPLSLHVYPLRFPQRPRLSLSGCEYSDAAAGPKGAAPAMNALIRFLQERPVDSPWAHEGVLSLPGTQAFDANDRLVARPDFERLDRWLALWPHARQYFVYLARTTGTGLSGADMDTERFQRRLAAWTRAFAEHVRSRGLKPSQFYFLVVDEPTQPLQCRTIVAWHKAFQGVVDRPTLWVTFFAAPDPEFFQQMLATCDMLCPHIPAFLEWKPTTQQSVFKHVRRQKSLWLYSAIGPSRTMDPYSYYRLLPWLCYRHGARGCIFWAFGDVGHAPSSWNDYMVDGRQYVPQYFEADRMTDSKQMQAIVEGVQDHEYLCLLADRLTNLERQGPNDSRVAAAEKLLKLAVEEVTGGLRLADLYWSKPKDRSVADRVRVEILEMLTALSPAAAQKPANHPQR